MKERDINDLDLFLDIVNEHHDKYEKEMAERNRIIREIENFPMTPDKTSSTRIFEGSKSDPEPEIAYFTSDRRQVPSGEQQGNRQQNMVHQSNRQQNMVHQSNRQQNGTYHASTGKRNAESLRKDAEKLRIEKEMLKKIQREKRRRMDKFKRTVSGIIAAATLGGILHVVTDSIADSATNISSKFNAKKLLVEMAEENLAANGLGTINHGRFKIGENSAADYSVLDADTQVEVYAYLLAINDYEEFNKFITSVSYNNGQFNYQSFEQFLNVNGYYDQTTSRISTEVFENYMEAAIAKAYKNNTFGSYEDEFSYTDYVSTDAEEEQTNYKSR